MSHCRRHIIRRSSLIAVVLLLTACHNGTNSNGTPIPTATRPASAVASPSIDASPGTGGTPTEPATATATTPPTATDASPTQSGVDGEVPVYGYDIINTYPHDPNAFTQGLDFADGVLYEGTGLNGRSSLRRVELETGNVLQQVDLPEEYFGEGIVVLGDRIFQITWQSQTAFVYDRESFEQIETHAYPTQGWGLTTDGERLIMSDGSSTLFFRDPETFAEVRRVDVQDAGEPVTLLNELEWVNGEVWANVWQTDRIVRINPATGEVVGWIDLTGLLQPEDGDPDDVDVLNGIALDETTGRLFVTGKFWPVIYEIEVVGP